MTDRVIHVLPIDDTGLHAESGFYCNCNPTVEWVDGAAIVVHNSFDGRELFREPFGEPKEVEWPQAPVAQGIERSPPKRQAAGSIPAGSARLR